MSTIEDFVLGIGAIADRFGVTYKLVHGLIRRLGIGYRIGRSWVVKTEDLYQIEIALRASGYPRPKDAQKEDGVQE